MEGRFLGGRPPYGYRIVDLGPHPNPSKAAVGQRLHGLGLDEQAAPIVARIFAEFITGTGLYAIAQGLTRDGIPCPSAHDRDRNRHRSGVAWSKSAIRAILTNPRYTGHQVWNRQRKQEILLDVDDVALGHETKMRWNDQQVWLRSTTPSHPAILPAETFQLAQNAPPPLDPPTSRACPAGVGVHGLLPPRPARAGFRGRGGGDPARGRGHPAGSAGGGHRRPGTAPRTGWRMRVGCRCCTCPATA